MALFNIADKNLVALEKTTYSIEGFRNVTICKKL